jgi:hypothetical protein
MAALDLPALARAQAMNRVAIGAGLMLAPGAVGRLWVGSWAKDERTRVLARAVGARDLALGASGLLALRRGDTEGARLSFAGQALADAVDFAALTLADRRVPRAARVLGGTLAAGSAALAAAYAARLKPR